LVEIGASDFALGNAPHIDIAVNDAGVLVAWEGKVRSKTLLARALDADGRPVEPEQPIPLVDEPRAFRLLALADGRFVLLASTATKGDAMYGAEWIGAMLLDSKGALAHSQALARTKSRDFVSFHDALVTPRGVAVQGHALLGPWYIIEVVASGDSLAIQAEPLPKAWSSVDLLDAQVLVGPDGHHRLLSWQDGPLVIRGAGGVEVSRQMPPAPHGAFAIDDDGTLVAARLARLPASEEVEGWRWSDDEQKWVAANNMKRSLFPPEGMRSYFVVDQSDPPGIGLFRYGESSAARIASAPIPKRRAKVAWSGAKFVVVFPMLKMGTWTIYSQTMTCKATPAP
jgi:hypothetical protein